MKCATLIARRISQLTPEQLVRLLDVRDLPGCLGGARPPRSPGELADHLLTDASVQRGVNRIDDGGIRVLLAITRLAEELHGPVPRPRTPANPWTVSTEPDLEPADRAVPRAEVLRRLAPDTENGAEALARVVEQLEEQFLILPAGRGAVTVPPLLHRASAELAGHGRPIDDLLSDAFNASEIHAIANTLGVGRDHTRDASQRRITNALGDAGTVRALADQAPPAAAELLAKLAAGPALLRTHCFVSRYPGYRGPDTKFVYRQGGSGDPGTDWLAARGLVLPVDHDLAELPYEVGRALRERDGDAVDATPPGLSATSALHADAEGQARLAATAAGREAELVLGATAARPVPVRKAGGLAVRDTRRIAKEADADDKHTRLWIDLAVQAGLLASHADHDDVSTPARTRGRGRSRRTVPDPPVTLMPTDHYDAWSTADPADRLLPLLATWAVVPEAFTYWPSDSDETPVALIAPTDTLSSTLRRGLLAALTTVPAGRGTDPADPATLAELLDLAIWFRPALADFAGTAEMEERAVACLAEAEYLGVTAHGALSAIGRAVLGLLAADADLHFPAFPGAGPDLAGRPRLASAVDALRDALREALPAPRTTARFQADLTATVLGTPAAELAALLESTAVRESEGHAVVWRLSAGSVRRALDSGLDADTLLARLAAASEDGAELPQPLAYLVRDTARVHGRLRVVRSACCLRSDDEHLITEVAATRSLAKLGLRRIAPTVLISTADPDVTLSALRAAGYAPVLEAATGSTVVELGHRVRVPANMPELDEPVGHFGPGGSGAPTTARALAAALLAAGPR